MTIGVERSEPVCVAPDPFIPRVEDVGTVFVALDARRGIDACAGVAADRIPSFQNEDGKRELGRDPLRDGAPRNAGTDDNNGK